MLKTVGILSGLALLALAAGCASTGADDAESMDDALTVRPHGAARFTLTNTFSTAPTPPLMFAAEGDRQKDPFVFAGDALTLSVPTYQLWPTLYPNIAEPYSDLAREQQLHAEIHVTGLKNGAPVSNDVVTTRGLRGGDGSTTFHTFTDAPPFAVPANADTLAFSIDVIDDSNGARKTIPYPTANTGVIGSSVPDKTILFDEANGARRHRVLEGGNAVKGATVAIAFTDYRADNVVGAYHVNRKIGRGRNSGHYGDYEDMRGPIEHEVSVGYAFDGAFQPELGLAVRAPSRFVFGVDRKTHEGTISVPPGASSFVAYFHVKTYVRYTYDHRQFYDVALEAPEGSRALISERWDNADSQPGANYDLPLETR